VPAQDNHPLTDLFPWVIERLDQPLTVEDLARQARMSSRNLGRHFRAATGTTPLQWLLPQRIRRAQELLETTDDSVDAIAAATGMGTATTLRRHFRFNPGRLFAQLRLPVGARFGQAARPC
jgi:AraC family transcriptional regulator, transcriptional activator FtrA